MERPTAQDASPDPPAGEDGGPVLTFDDGIPGFGPRHQFALSDLTPDGTFQMLTCLEDPELSFVVTSPWLFFPEYAPEIADNDRSVLELEEPSDAIVFCSVIAEDTDELVLNLRAPFIANSRTRHARQVILEDESLPLRAPVPVEG